STPVVPRTEPTAQMSSAETAAIPLSDAPAGTGLATMLQLAPSKCSSRTVLLIRGSLPVEPKPTAQTLFGATAETESRPLPTGVFSGAGTVARVQVLPSKCSASGAGFGPAPPRKSVSPTAQTSVPELAETPKRPAVALKAGLVTMLHLVP